jgi:hypothetical protein
VRNLVVVGGTPTLRGVVRLCTAAPQLRRLQAEIWRDDPYPSWLTSNDDALTDEGAASSRLRHLIVTRAEAPAPEIEVADDCVSRLRQHFARLQQVTVDEKDFFE